jgi:hypothetical protein
MGINGHLEGTSLEANASTETRDMRRRVIPQRDSTTNRCLIK